jgi:hypothetical protein
MWNLTGNLQSVDSLNEFICSKCYIDLLYFLEFIFGQSRNWIYMCMKSPHCLISLSQPQIKCYQLIIDLTCTILSSKLKLDHLLDNITYI